MQDSEKITHSDQDLIHDEVQRYQKCHREVAKILAQKERELEENQQEARSLTSRIVATQREEEKQALQSDELVAHSLVKLRLSQSVSLTELLEQPYFARVIYHENNRDTEFRLGVFSVPELRIVDWRKGPISKLYYDYEEGQAYDDEIAGVEREGEIKLRRSYRGQRDILSAIELKDHSYVLSKGAWHKQKKFSGKPFSLKDREEIKKLMAEFNEEAFLKTRTASGYLHQVLSLLTPEQFRMISTEIDKPIIIQGAAGTGKTTVALHRLAWLFFAGNSLAREENALVIVYSHSLAQYVKHVLPELGIHHVKILTYDEWQRDLHAGKLPAELDYLVIDEAQDFSAEQLATILDTLKDKRQLTLAGDLGQRIGDDKWGDWQDLLGMVGLQGVEVLSLKIAYRSTYQIYELAEYVRDPNLPDDDLHMLPKFGPEPYLTLCSSLADAALETEKWIHKVFHVGKNGTAAVICKTRTEARSLFDALLKLGCRGIRYGDAKYFEFTPGITITDVHQVKGLEFHNVLVFNPSEKNYSSHSPHDRNLLYVAITRAEHQLGMLCFDPPSALIPDFVNINDLTVVNPESENAPLFSDVDQDVSAFEDKDEE